MASTHHSHLEQLHQAITQHFDYQQLERLLQFQFGMVLGNIAPNAGFETVAFEVLKAFDHKGQLGVLVKTLREARPNADFSGRPKATHSFLMPFPRKWDLVGREADLARLHTHLQTSNTNASAITPTAALSGMGGIGKTQLAVEYCYRYRDEYDGGVFLVNAAEDVREAFATIGDHLGAVGGSNIEQRLQRAVDHLHDNPNSLVVLDNFDRKLESLNYSLISGVFPLQLKCRLLLTTRQSNLPTSVDTINLDLLSPPAAREIFVRERADLQDDPDLGALCEKLGHLPLALKLAANALARRRKMSCAAYAEQLEKIGLDAINRRAKIKQPVDYRKDDETEQRYRGLMPVLLEQWDSLSDDEPETAEDARKLLRVAGLFDESARLPIARLGLFADLEDIPHSGFEDLGDAVRLLTAHSLMEQLDDDHVRLHPLVHKFARGMTAEDELADFTFACVGHLLEAYEDIEPMAEQYAERGIDAVQTDLLEALHLLAHASAPQPQALASAPQPQTPARHTTIPPRVETLLRLIQREAHNLRQPEAAKPHKMATFAQQALHRAFDLKLPLLTRAAQVVERLKQAAYWPNWLARNESVALERTLTGHGDWVRSVTVTPDGKRVLSGSDDQTLRVWNLDTGELERTLTGHSDLVRSVSVTPDGKHALSGSSDKTLRVWNLDTGELVHTLTGHSNLVRSVTVTPDGKRAVSGSSDKTLRVWNLDTGELEHTFTGHSGLVRSVTVTPDGKHVLSGSDDQTLRVWNLDTGELERTLTGHSNLVRSVTVTPDGKRVLSGSSDQTLRVWNLDTSELERTLTEHSGWVGSVTVTPDGKRAVSGSSDKTLRVWNLNTGELECMLTGHGDWVRSVTVTPDGKRALSGSSDQTLRVWNLDTGMLERTLIGHSSLVRSVTVTPDGKRALSGSDDQTLRVWNLDTGELERTLTGHSNLIRSVTVTPDGKRALSGSDDKTLRVWNLGTGELERTITGHSNLVLSVTVAPDGKRALSGSDDKIRVWNLDTGKLERMLTGHGDWVRSVIVTPNGQQAVSVSTDRTIRIWQLATGQQLAMVAVDAILVCVAVHGGVDGGVNGQPLTVVAGDAAGSVYCFEVRGLD